MHKMISWKALGVALLFGGVLGGIKLLFDLVDKNRRPYVRNSVRSSSAAVGAGHLDAGHREEK
jgi:hypothetical protein